MSRTPNDFHAPIVPLRSSWNTTRMLVRKPLTDRRIDHYRKLGYYDPAFQQARRDLWIRRQAQRTSREGNFDRIDGRLIFRP